MLITKFIIIQFFSLIIQKNKITFYLYIIKIIMIILSWPKSDIAFFHKKHFENES